MQAKVEGPSKIPSPYTNDSPPEIETHSNQQHVEVEDLIDNSTPPPVIISRSESSSDEQEVVVETNQVDWQAINQTKIGQLNQINQQILEHNQQYLFIQNLYKEALVLQQRLDSQLTVSRNEIPAPSSEIIINELMDSSHRSIISTPLQSFDYGERLSSMYDLAINKAKLVLKNIKDATQRYGDLLKNIQKDIKLKRQELTENNAEIKRVEIFNEHIKLININDEDTKLSTKNLKSYSQPIKRFINSEFQGVPNVKGITLMSIAAKGLNFDDMNSLLSLGYKLTYNSSELIKPLAVVMAHQAVSNLLNALGSKLSAQEFNDIFKLYLLPLIDNLKLEFTKDHQNTLTYIINNNFCSAYHNQIFELVFDRDEMLSSRGSLLLNFFNNYQNFVDLNDGKRIEFINLILTELSQSDAKQSQFLNLYSKSNKLYAVNLLSDFNVISQGDMALDWVINSDKPLNIINNEILEHAYLAFKQGQKSLLTNSLVHNMPQVSKWFDSIELRHQQPNIKLDLICLNASCFDIKQWQSAFSELNTNEINKNFEYLSENITNTNDVLTTAKVLTIFSREQISKTEDLKSLLELSKQVNNGFGELDGNDKYQEIILKQIKNKMLSILKINSDVSPELKDDIKVFMASHRTKGWSLLCGLLYIPPTFLATPSSNIYDSIVKGNKEQVESKLLKQQQNFDAGYEKIFEDEVGYSISN